MVSVFGRRADVEGPEGYVFFAADSQAPTYELVKNVVSSQMYVSAFRLHDYPVAADDVLHTGPAAFDAALNTVNVGKFNLGFASIGICEHAFYEAITHAHNRVLYGRTVTDFPHVAQMLTDAYARLLAMKLFGERSIDYFRSASPEDRRYLLYNPITKMKVTTEGERVIDLLWDVIAAHGFEEDTYFEMAASDIRALPKLEGTVHVNMALVLKFMATYFFMPEEQAPVPQRREAADDPFLFAQGPARGLSKIRFHDWRPVYDRFADLPNVARFIEQAAGIPALLQTAPPDEDQQRDLDFMLTLGELFTLVVYGQLILEQAELTGQDRDVVDQIFDVLVRDFSAFAIDLHGKPSTTAAQQAWALEHVRGPVVDAERFGRVFAQVTALSGAYEMRAVNRASARAPYPLHRHLADRHPAGPHRRPGLHPRGLRRAQPRLGGAAADGREGRARHRRDRGPRARRRRGLRAARRVGAAAGARRRSGASAPAPRSRRRPATTTCASASAT